ncbi:autophagy protein Apg9-domain-containing protein [Sporodiniella umbellata]|nr:autophagy protein Apg9-domain-containing protein [Sporodiniella umbellata]
MSSSRLLRNYSDEDEEEFNLNQVKQQYSSEEDEDLEAPASLILERPTVNNTAHSTREHVSTIDRTMWRWANVENMDYFFQRVYEYYQGKGIYCILLARLLNLLTLVFMIVFSTLLIGCVNYSEIPTHHSLNEVLVPQCLSKLSTTKSFYLTMFVLWWGWQVARFVTDIPALREMHNFYIYLLNIPDEDMQTVSWQTVLERIIEIRENNPNTSEQSSFRLTEYDVANRIMRKENYLIALLNKDKLNLMIPLPYLKDRKLFTKDIEWNLSFCLFDFVFDKRGQVRKRFLKEKNKPILVAGLKRRFVFMGLLNCILAPFIFVYLLLFFFFKYFEVRHEAVDKSLTLLHKHQEYHKDPGQIGSRTYSPIAKWEFREFNELPHLFRTRISQSYEFANRYVNQFPKEKTILMARFVSFVAGSFAGVLALFTLFDSEALVNFEITPNSTVLFYLGITGTLFAITRGMIPDENQVFEPEALLKQVIEHTHYLPTEWKHKLHTDQVRGEFCLLFDYKVGLFLQELLSVFFAPLVLCFSLPKSADQIVDFIREFTVHENGLGYVCSFAKFDFERHGNPKYGVQGVTADDEYYMSKEGKMEKSLVNFKTNHPHWEPADLAGSLYLSRLERFKNEKRKDSPPNEEPIRLNKYGIPAVPSSLGDSFEQETHTWRRPTIAEEDEEEEFNERGEVVKKNVVGILNQFYDYNNNPNV